ncbi:MAG: hypothetical protein IJZ22_03950 [Bacteroidaceae bacterium]|nr:hypothetical protein [Bacteroidaceae bacterium]
MGFFKMGAPRKFEHKYIYVDERREKLDKIVDNAKRDLGMLPPEELSYKERIKGTFQDASTHLKRRKQNGSRLKTPTLIVALFIAIFILHYLLTGSWAF